MKKIVFVSALLLMFIASACCKVNAQSSEFTLEGKTIEIHKWNGVNFQYAEKAKMDISLYFNWSTDPPTFMVVVNKIPENWGILGPTEFYTKKNKAIEPSDVDKMKAKGKLDHYILNSKQSMDNSSYNFYVPNSILSNEGGSVIFIKTMNNQSEMYKFKVQEWYNGKPELPSSIQNEFK